MLLTCPACSARYEVPATALPAEGRVVRCTNCRAEWLARPVAVQTPSPATPAPPPAPPATPQAPAPVQAVPEPRLAVQSPPVLNPGATAAMAGPEAEATRPPAAAAPPPRKLPDLPTAPPRVAEAEPEPRAEAPAPRRGTDPAEALARSFDGEAQGRRGGGFVTGFATVSVIALLAAATYIKHAEIAAALPQLAGPLERYVAMVDDGRMQLERLIERLRTAAG